MDDQKEDRWMHAYTPTEEEPHLLCLVLSCRRSIYLSKQLQEIEDLEKGTRLMVSTSSQMQESCAPAPVPSYTPLLGMVCSV